MAICEKHEKTWTTLSKFNFNNKNNNNVIPRHLSKTHFRNDFFLSTMKPNDALCQESINHYDNSTMLI